MYHTFKAVVVERFNRTLKNIMWKHFTANNANRHCSRKTGLNDKFFDI